MGVGMVALHQFLIARLDLDQCQRQGEVEDRQGSLLLAERPLLCALPPFVANGFLLEAEEAEIADAPAEVKAGATAQGPGGPLPHRVVANLGLDLGSAHPRVVVPLCVVEAHVIEAEPEEGVERAAGTWCAILAARGTAGMVAEPRRGACGGTGRGFEARAGHLA